MSKATAKLKITAVFKTNGAQSITGANSQTALTGMLDDVYADVALKKVTISLPTASWVGSSSPYSQVIIISGSTANTYVEIQPNVTDIPQLQADGVTGLQVQNNNGTLTCYAVGGKPSVNLSVQMTYEEINS